MGTYALIDRRHRHAQLLQALALLGSCVEHLALELRLLRRTEVREVEEPRAGAFCVAHFQSVNAAELVAGLTVFPETMAASLTRHGITPRAPLAPERLLAHHDILRDRLETLRERITF
ncbi:hypothetical protein [Streptomyces mesophilus]|uniref:hypothetical protein n=1 Tax=Streptomyces mesophilus TaxID=1775132 RepID=UPI001F20F831|nr:hypothetical protein [Streptomyces mesophilus]